MDSLYSDDISKYLHSRDWPQSFRWRIIEINDTEWGRRYLNFQVFRDNINAMDGVDKLRVAKLMQEALMYVSKHGTPIYTQVVRGDGSVEGD